MAIGTQGALKTRIALELARPDILASDGRIADAITDAITTYQTEKFRFSEINPANPPTFTTSQGVLTYSDAAATPPLISNALYVNFLTYTFGTSVFYVRRVSPLEIIMANQNLNVSGPPEAFAIEGETIMLTPVPDQAYLMTADVHLLVPAPASDIVTGNRWMTDGEMLIRSRVKFEIATHITRNATMAMAMSPEAHGGPGGGPGATYRAWQNLKAEANRYTAKGKIRPMIW
jgi:hypothetical protein